jgi:hypothetical protein
LQVQIMFQPAFYFHLGLLHLSLLVRVIGDMASFQTARLWGGFLNEIAILLFLSLTSFSIWMGWRRSRA